MQQIKGQYRYALKQAVRVCLQNISDYSPFGAPLDGRTIQSDFYRRGFNGMEKDDEVKGVGNSYDFGARMYDSRLGRWLTIDPLASKYPSLSPYNFVGNSPVVFVDPDGEKIIIYYDSGEKNSEGEPILKSYEYGSGLKVPKDKFVKQAVKTLKKIERKGLDPNGIIEDIKTSETNHAAILYKANWNSTAAHISVGSVVQMDENGKVLDPNYKTGEPDLIFWNPNSGWISEDGKRTQSAANGLLHELGHTYYNIHDPLGMNEAYNKLHEIQDEVERDNAINEFQKKTAQEVGEYHTYSDKWIIENVESGFKESQRKNHSEGFFMNTKSSSFSRKGKEYGRWGETGKTKELKKGENVIQKPN
jgi:RHS repeat-associated protein